MPDDNMLDNAARALSEAEFCGGPMLPWNELPEEDTSFGYGKIRLRRMAQAVLDLVVEDDAKIVESFVDPEWPGDELSQQAKAIAAAIRA